MEPIALGDREETHERRTEPDAPAQGDAPMMGRSTLRSYFYFVRAYPGRSVLMLAAFVLAGLMEGIGAVGLLSLLSIALGETASDGLLARSVRSVFAFFGTEPTLPALVLLLIVVALAKASLTFFAMAQAGYTAAHVTTALRLDLMRALLRARWRFFVHHPIGESANAVATEAQRAAQTFLAGSEALAAFVLVGFYAAFAVLVSWQVSLLALAAGAALALLLSRLVRVARQAGGRQTESAKALAANLTGALSGLKAVKAMGREDRFARMLETDTLHLRDAHRRQVLSQHLLLAVSEPLTLILVAIGLFLALTYSSLAMSELLVLGLVALRLMQKICVAQAHLQRAAIAESALWSLLSAKEEAETEVEADGGRQRPTLAQGIAFRSVSFAYADQPVLSGIDLFVPAGTFAALYGPSGCGKTTLIDLLIGLHRPQQGEILLDGVPLPRIDMRAWRRSIGYVPQDTYLFHDSILNNVSLGDPGIGRAEVEAALRAAGAWDFIAALPDGIRTVVGEGGARFSGGQRQRIAIARALATRPLLFVLDEATAALDPATEREILATVKALAGEATVIAISHQPAVAEAADIVLRLDEASAGADVHTGGRSGLRRLG